MVKAIQVPKSILFGACKNEALVSTQGGTNKTPEEWHASCMGVIASKRNVIRCACPFHKGEPDRCLNCYATDEPLNSLLRCIDIEGCEARVRTRLDGNPLIQMIQECREQGAIDREEERKRKKIARERDPVQREAKKREGQCIHCGEPTRGGLFVAGHDMKMKGLLIAAARGGDVGSTAELIARGWFKPDIHKVAEVVVKEARSILSAHERTWLNDRVADRLDALANGAEPEDAIFA